MVKFPARKVLSALEKGDQATIKASQQVAIVFNQFVDAARVDESIQKDAKGAKSVGAAVREAFTDFVAIGAIQKTTVSNYAQGAARAFFHNVEWSARLFMDPALAIPSATTGKTRANAGSVKTTDSKAIVKTLTKALEQARLMQNDALAAGIVDLIIEIDPEFKEGAE